MLSEKSIQKKDFFIEKLVNVRRTAKVVKGGRIFGFSALVVVGNGNCLVGFGLGKAREVPLAIQKAIQKAKSKLFLIELCGGTLFYPIQSTHCATKIIMFPAYEGTGIIAGGSMRAVFESVGIKNVISKCIGSCCSMNVVLATLKGLLKSRSPDYFLLKRGVVESNVLYCKR